MNKSTTIAELTKALVKVQAAIGPAAMNSTNPHFRSKYADLNSIWDACRTLLTENGLAVIQTNAPGEVGVVVETTLAHESGEYITSELFLPLDKNTPQGVGSAITYGRRYGLAAIVGIVADEDDDGNAASKNGNGRPAPEMAHPGQITAIENLCKGKGLVFKDYILAAYPDVKGSAELTKPQAEELIKRLNTI
jgi:hypothetical protein